MISDQIPEGIREKAKALTLAEFDDESRPVWMHRDEFIDFTARAILAEREATEKRVLEKCARVPRKVVEAEGIEDGEQIELCNRIVDAVWEALHD